MTSGKPIIYWDTCVLLAWIKDETRQDDEMEGVYYYADRIFKKHIVLMTSALTDTEILESTLTEEAKKRLGDLFKRPNFQKADVDPKVVQLCAHIRDYYQKQKQHDGLPTLTVPDAIHLSTAIHYNASEFHTFDRNNETNKRRALIPLNGNVAGYPLIVCKPPAPAQSSLKLV